MQPSFVLLSLSKLFVVLALMHIAQWIASRIVSKVVDMFSVVFDHLQLAYTVLSTAVHDALMVWAI